MSELAEQVKDVISQRDRLNDIAGEVIATCLINLDRGAVKCSDPDFRKFLEIRSEMRREIMNGKPRD